MNPKLRPLQPEPTLVDGRPMIVLRDPLRLSDRTVAIPQALGLLLALCDGTRDVDGLRAAFQVRSGVYISPDQMAALLQDLDEALLLDNDAARLAYTRALMEYRNAPYRTPALAGSGYPADPNQLAAMLDNWLAQAPTGKMPLLARGLVSPHIDYARGGAIYAEVWSRVAATARRAEVVVILGTDHTAEQALLTLTHQSYATPFGVLPTEHETVDALAQVLGQEAAFAEEIHHRHEHSIELAAVWLHHIRRGNPVALVPILCGAFHRFLFGGEDPAGDAGLTTIVETLRQRLAGRRALVVAAGDLAHSGPAFGDRIPAGPAVRAQGEAADNGLITAITRGQPGAFLHQIKAEGDRRHICGVAPIYLALRLLEPVRGEPAGYAQLPADGQGNSFVSVCGVALL